MAKIYRKREKRVKGKRKTSLPLHEEREIRDEETDSCEREREGEQRKTSE